VETTVEGRQRSVEQGETKPRTALVSGLALTSMPSCWPLPLPTILPFELLSQSSTCRLFLQPQSAVPQNFVHHLPSPSRTNYHHLSHSLTFPPHHLTHLFALSGRTQQPCPAFANRIYSPRLHGFYRSSPFRTHRLIARSIFRSLACLLLFCS